MIVVSHDHQIVDTGFEFVHTDHEAAVVIGTAVAGGYWFEPARGWPV